MLKELATLAGLIAAFAVIDAPVWASDLGKDPAEARCERIDARQPSSCVIVGQVQPSVPALEQGGKVIEDKAPNSPLTEPLPNLQKDDRILQQDADVAKQESVSDIIQESQDEDLVTDDYVGNPNYFDMSGGQQFGDEGFEYSPWGFQPYSLGF
jgi:hypothetical protein